MKEKKNRIKKDLFNGVICKEGNRQTAGITLIALVITIIVLLILAGITIAQLSQSGLLKNTKLAKQEYTNAQSKEETEIAKATDEIDSYVNGNRNLSITDEEYKIQHTMSGTEHFTGDYYWNGKPIYTKTIYISSLPNSSESTYNHGIENIDVIWYDLQNCLYVWNLNNKEFSSFVYLHSKNNDARSMNSLGDVNATNFTIITGYDRSSASAYITLRYTKTTDTATVTTAIPATTAN